MTISIYVYLKSRGCNLIDVATGYIAHALPQPKIYFDLN